MGLFSVIGAIGGFALGGKKGAKVGASLGGGFDDSKSAKKQRAATDAHNDPAAIRARYEAAGFNPLLGIANANPNRGAVNYQPQMGSLLSDAISLIQSNNIDQQAIDIDRTRLELDQKRTKAYIEKQTIRPKEGGIYAKAADGAPNPEEIQRLDVPSGGSIGEDNIYNRKHPIFGEVSTEYPAIGQRIEDEKGDLLGAPELVPYVLSDYYHNLKGEYYDSRQQKWKKVIHLNTGGRTKWNDNYAVQGTKPPQFKKRGIDTFNGIGNPYQ
jgi:hypothetical protein